MSKTYEIIYRFKDKVQTASFESDTRSQAVNKFFKKNGREAQIIRVRRTK